MKARCGHLELIFISEGKAWGGGCPVEGGTGGGGGEVPVTNSLIKGGVPVDCSVLESP